MATLSFYGFEKKIEIPEFAYESGKVSVALFKPLKKFVVGGVTKVLDVNNFKLDFYLDTDGIWRI